MPSTHTPNGRGYTENTSLPGIQELTESMQTLVLNCNNVLIPFPGAVSWIKYRGRSRNLKIKTVYHLFSGNTKVCISSLEFVAVKRGQEDIPGILEKIGWRDGIDLGNNNGKGTLSFGVDYLGQH